MYFLLGTKTHIVMLDLRSKNLKGNKSAKKLEEAGILAFLQRLQ